MEQQLVLTTRKNNRRKKDRQSVMFPLRIISPYGWQYRNRKNVARVVEIYIISDCATTVIKTSIVIQEIAVMLHVWFYL